MKLKRSAVAVWHGTGLEGSGQLTAPSGVLDATPYSFHARFVDENGTAGTNPEELIAAAHAGCFSMALSFGLAAAGFPAESLRTEALMTVEKEDIGWTIRSIVLKLEGKVPGMDAAAFQQAAEGAKANCPVSRVLNAEITLDARLV
ncbi:MAG: OsmC family protein [Bacteroidia bacterium]|nr:OsmC family protein [Bacteroidia bacterium]